MSPYLTTPTTDMVTMPSMRPAYESRYEVRFSELFDSSDLKFTSLKAYGRPNIPAPINEMKMLANTLTLLSVPSSCISKKRSRYQQWWALIRKHYLVT